MEVLLKVRNIKTKQSASLVECKREDGSFERKIIPSELIIHEGENSFIKKEDFDMGMSYGLPLEDIVKDIYVPARTVINNFHAIGLWTYEDFMSRPNEIISSIMSSTGLNLNSILQGIKAHKKGEHHE